MPTSPRSGASWARATSSAARFVATATRLRVTAQLVEAATGGALRWSQRYDVALADIFGVQDDITRQLAGAMAVRLDQLEQARIATKPPGSLEVYDLVLRGRKLVERGDAGEQSRGSPDPGRSGGQGSRPMRRRRWRWASALFELRDQRLDRVSRRMPSPRPSVRPTRRWRSIRTSPAPAGCSANIYMTPTAVRSGAGGARPGARGQSERCPKLRDRGATC